MSYIGSDPNFSSVFGDAAKDTEFDHVFEADEDDELMEAVENLGDRSMGDSQGENDKNAKDIEDELKGTGYEDDIESGLDIDATTGLEIELGSYDVGDADDDLSDMEGATTSAAKDGEKKIASREPVGEWGDMGLDNDSLDLENDMDLTDYEDTESLTDYDDDEDYEPDDDFELEACESKDDDEDEDTVDESGNSDSEDDDTSDEDLDLDESFMLMIEADADTDVPEDIDDEDLDESYYNLSEADEEDELEDGDIEAIDSEDDGELTDAEVKDLVDAGGDDDIIDDLL